MNRRGTRMTLIMNSARYASASFQYVLMMPKYTCLPLFRMELIRSGDVINL